MRFAKTKIRGRYKNYRGVLNVGYGETIDCATLIAAQELGLFRKHGLKVRLWREVGWTTIREKLLHEELDAAATHASMLFSIYCGIGGVVRRSCLTGLLLARNGSAITLAKEFWDLGVRDAASLGAFVHECKGRRTLTFGIVQELSSQNSNLRTWLKSGGIDPDEDVHLVVIPSALMHVMLGHGHLDGYCVAEPWNSAAVMDGTGWIVKSTSEIESGHPEKALLVLQEFAEEREEEHLRMIAALIEASHYCEQPENRSDLARMLARPCYFDVDKKLLLPGLATPFKFGRERPPVKDFVIYDALKAGAPTRIAGRWVFNLVRNLGGNENNPALRTEIIPKVFREDIFNRAVKLVESSKGKNRTPPFQAGVNNKRGTGVVVPAAGLTPKNRFPATERSNKPPTYNLSKSTQNKMETNSTALCA